MKFLSRRVLTAGVRAAGFERRCNVRRGDPSPPATLDGRRTWGRAMREVLGYPRLPIGPGFSIVAGKAGWETFARRAYLEHLDLTVEVLLAIDTSRNTTAGYHREEVS